MTRHLLLQPAQRQAEKKALKQMDASCPSQNSSPKKPQQTPAQVLTRWLYFWPPWRVSCGTSLPRPLQGETRLPALLSTALSETGCGLTPTSGHRAVGRDSDHCQEREDGALLATTAESTLRHLR